MEYKIFNFWVKQKFEVKYSFFFVWKQFLHNKKYCLQAKAIEIQQFCSNKYSYFKQKHNKFAKKDILSTVVE